MPSKYNTYRIFYRRIFFVTFVASSQFSVVARSSAFLLITLEILIFECFRKVLHITAAHHRHWNVVAMPLVSNFPDFIRSFIGFNAIAIPRSNRAARFISSRIESPQNNTCSMRLKHKHSRRSVRKWKWMEVGGKTFITRLKSIAISIHIHTFRMPAKWSIERSVWVSIINLKHCTCLGGNSDAARCFFPVTDAPMVACSSVALVNQCILNKLNCTRNPSCRQQHHHCLHRYHHRRAKTHTPNNNNKKRTHQMPTERFFVHTMAKKRSFESTLNPCSFHSF